MFYEERMIDGVMHWRGHPEDEFTPYTLQELSERYNSLCNQYNQALKRVVEETGATATA